MQSFAEGVREFEGACYRATDRLALTTRSAYDLEWGNLILLLAWDGKLGLISKLCSERGEAPPPSPLQADLARLRESWTRYVQEFRPDVVRDLDEQFERSIVARLRTAVAVPEALGVVEDVERFLAERDTIELFLEAADAQFPDRGFRGRIERLDARSRTLIVGTLRPRLARHYPAAVLAELDGEWLPRGYWWRHVDWTAAAGERS